VSRLAALVIKLTITDFSSTITGEYEITAISTGLPEGVFAVLFTALISESFISQIQDLPERASLIESTKLDLRFFTYMH
jgi:hypothetical protein